MIRPIEEKDYTRFADLAVQLGYPVDPLEAAAQLRRRASRPEEATFVLETEGKVIGWIGCRVVEQGYRPAYGEVTGLVIDSPHRSQGFGAELLARAEDWFREQGLIEVIVRSGSQREGAHRFYEREGYGRLKTQVVFNKEI